MSLNSDKAKQIVLAVLVSLIAAAAAVGGFVIGRSATQDAFITRIGAESTTLNETLSTAGIAPLSLLQVLGRRVDDHYTMASLARIYHVPEGDRAGLLRLLQEIVWNPPYKPAPVVGHIARAYFGQRLRINFLGFRDARDSYLAKAPDTVRIFLTGGSLTWGTGVTSQDATIAVRLERVLNSEVGSRTGVHYEVINTGFPAWTTTQEKLLIEQRLVDLHPDMILMLSGNNDVHWSMLGRDIRWHYSYMDQNYVSLINEVFAAARRPEAEIAFPFSSRPIDCADLARITTANIRHSALIAKAAGARLVFALQPNITSTGKRLSTHEVLILKTQDKAYWDSCYQAFRDGFSPNPAVDYDFVDLSRSFGELDEGTELFIDPYHVGDIGADILARSLAHSIDWMHVKAGGAVPQTGEPLGILSVGDPDADHRLRIHPNHINNNLVAVLDDSVRPTVIESKSLVMSLPARVPPGPHKIFIADTMTGETSLPMAFVP